MFALLRWMLVVPAVFGGQAAVAAVPGELSSIYHLGRYTTAQLEQINDDNYRVNLGGAFGYLIQDEPDAEVVYEVDAYSVVYWTTDYDGTLVLGSGLYAEPVTGDPKEVVMYLHGTAVTFWDTPSNIDPAVFDGPLVLVYVAGRGGHTLLMPDGTGFWLSEVEQHRYQMGEVEGRTALHMWEAVQQAQEFLAEDHVGDLHVFGFSAGGLSALWFQRLYEAAGGVVAENTLMGALTNPEKFSLENMGKVSKYYRVYDAFMFETWLNTDGGTVCASSVFKQPSEIELLYDMDHSFPEVAGGLKNTVGATYIQAFAHDFVNNANNPAREFFRESDATVGWCPQTGPLYFHQLEDDTEVSLASVMEAQVALNTCWGSSGANLIVYGDEAVPLQAYIGAGHLELQNNLLGPYADGTLPGLPW